MSLRMLVTLKLRIEFKRSAGGVGSISEEACLNPLSLKKPGGVGTCASADRAGHWDSGARIICVGQSRSRGSDCRCHGQSWDCRK